MLHGDNQADKKDLTTGVQRRTNLAISSQNSHISAKSKQCYILQNFLLFYLITNQVVIMNEIRKLALEDTCFKKHCVCTTASFICI